MASYWEQFKHEAFNEAFWMGVYEGIKAYAWWRKGTQYVGTTGTTLKEAIREIENLRWKWAKEEASRKYESAKAGTRENC